jgi:hypothetical protein
VKKLNVSWTVKKIVYNIDKGNVLFNHPIQRKSGQWSDEQKSLLIHSLLSDYPVPPLYAVQDQNENSSKYSVLDGKQRLTVLQNYIKDGWKLMKEMPEVIINETTYDISGLKFSQLPEDAREELESANLLMYIFEDCSDDEIEEIFYRLNNGTALTKDQKTRIRLGDRLARFIDEVLELDFFKTKAYFSPYQLKRAEDQTCILQTLMLLVDYKYKTFNNSDVLEFAEYYRENYKEDDLQECIKLFRLLDNAFTEKHKQIKKINIPMFVMALKATLDMDSSFELYSGWVNKFIDSYNPKCEYAQYCGQGSTHKDKILKRLDLTYNDLIDYISEKEVHNEF